MHAVERGYGPCSSGHQPKRAARVASSLCRRDDAGFLRAPGALRGILVAPPPFLTKAVHSEKAPGEERSSAFCRPRGRTFDWRIRAPRVRPSLAEDGVPNCVKD